MLIFYVAHKKTYFYIFETCTARTAGQAIAIQRDLQESDQNFKYLQNLRDRSIGGRRLVLLQVRWPRYETRLEAYGPSLLQISKLRVLCKPNYIH